MVQRLMSKPVRPHIIAVFFLNFINDYLQWSLSHQKRAMNLQTFFYKIFQPVYFKAMKQKSDSVD